MIALSAVPCEDLRPAVENAGITKYFEKPLSPVDVVKVVIRRNGYCPGGYGLKNARKRSARRASRIKGAAAGRELRVLDIPGQPVVPPG